MAGIELTQIAVTAVLSSSVVGGLVTVFGRKINTPEAKNDLARLGNEFAHQLLQDAKVEREELRLTIRELETANLDKDDTIARLNRLLSEKDEVIQVLEERQFVVARKIQQGLVITLQDIFGEKAPPGIRLTTNIDSV